MIDEIRRIVVLALGLLAIGLLVAGCGGGTFVPYTADPPGAPRMLSAELTPNNEALLTWEAPAPPAGDTRVAAPITGYRVYMQCDNGSVECDGGRIMAIGTTSSLSYLHRGLAPGTTYVFFVRALSERGPSPPSGSDSVDTGAPAGAIAVPRVTVRADETSRTVEVSWIHVGNSGNSNDSDDSDDSDDSTAAVGFELQYCSVPSSHGSDVCTNDNGWQPARGVRLGATSRSFNDLHFRSNDVDCSQESRMYRVRALAHEPSASSRYSAPTRPVCPGDYSIPRRVDAVFAEAPDMEEVKICWRPADDNGDPVSGYEMQISPSDSLPEIEGDWLIVDAHIDPDSHSTGGGPVCVRYSGLVVEDERWFRVRAYNSAGHGDWSAPYRYLHLAPTSRYRNRLSSGGSTDSRISVSDAQASEAVGRLVFEVTLTPAVPAPVTVDYETMDGTAQAPGDYRAVSGTLTIAPNEGRATIEVTIVNDGLDDAGEVFTVLLRNAVGATISDGEATGTILNDGPIPKAWLARLGRTIADQVAAAVGARLEGRMGTHATLAGVSLGLTGVTGTREAAPEGGFERLNDAGAGRHRETRTVAEREALRGSSFFLASEGAGPGLAAWGHVTTQGFDADFDDLAMDGEVTTGVAGADVERWRWLAGVAFSHSEAEGSFGPGSGTARERGRTESSLTGVYPYARVTLNRRVSLWGLAGVGRGELSLAGAGRSPVETDIEAWLGAVGVQGTILPATEADGFELAVAADAFQARMASDAVGSESAGNLAASRSGANRLRLVLSGSRALAVGAHGTLTPNVEAGVRHDGGDAETGTGFEIGAGIRYAAGGISVDGAVHALVSHEEDGYEESGASASVRIDPGASGRGLSLTLSPTLGAPSGGAGRLWSAGDPGWPAEGSGGASRRRVDAEIGYGVNPPGTGGVLTPYSGVSLADGGARTWSLGARFRAAPGLHLSLGGTRREGRADPPEHGVALRGAIRW